VQAQKEQRTLVFFYTSSRDFHDKEKEVMSWQEINTKDAAYKSGIAVASVESRAGATFTAVRQVGLFLFCLFID
jgi:hypothetical protein